MRKKVVLAYSGGLDTSIILRWLQTERDLDVVCFTADIGQGDEVEEARVKALATGAVAAHALDLREEFDALACRVVAEYATVPDEPAPAGPSARELN